MDDRGITYYPDKITAWGEISSILFLALNAISIWTNWNSQYNYWILGRAMGQTFMNTFILIDKWSNTQMIKRAWRVQRYLRQKVEWDDIPAF